MRLNQVTRLKEDITKTMLLIKFIMENDYYLTLRMRLPGCVTVLEMTLNMSKPVTNICKCLFDQPISEDIGWQIDFTKDCQCCHQVVPLNMSMMTSSSN